MRVITGKFKGRTLVAPKNSARPTLDRMKETLFNVLGDKTVGARVLDLFAGSGQLAIECLSRGAESAVVCDNDVRSIAAIKANFAKIGCAPQLYCGDYRQCLARLTEPMDLIFLDPPYKSDYYTEVLEILAERSLLSKTGTVVCEHSAEDILPERVKNIVKYDCRKIGSVKFSFYRWSEQ